MIQINYGAPQNAQNIAQQGSIVGQLATSQVRPVVSGSSLNLPFNQTLVPYPSENPLYPANILNLPGKI